MNAPNAKQPSITRLLPNQMSEGEHAHRTWSVRAESSMTMDMLLAPEAYVNVERMLRLGDHVEITAADGSWYVEVLVRAVETGIQIGVLNKVKFKPLQGLELDLYDIEPAGSNPATFRVVRKADRAVMKAGFETELKAYIWIEQSNKAPQKVAA